MKFGFSSAGFAPGFSLICSSIFLLILGLYRGEIGALIWGGGLSFILFVCAFSVIITAFFNRRERKEGDPDEVLPLNGQSGEPGVAIEGAFSLPGTYPRIPGVVVEYQLSYKFHNRFFSLKEHVKKGRNIIQLSFVPEKRGFYRGKASLLIRDLPGIFQVEIPLRGRGTLTVFPPRKDPEEGEHFPSLGGRTSPEVNRKRVSSELYDVRKYYPGDDPRRLHWKLYAHSGELFLRRGEPEPPPSGLFQVVMDLSIGEIEKFRWPFFKGRRNFKRKMVVLEEFLSKAAGLLESLLHKGGSLVILIPGSPSCATFLPGEEKALLTFLADLWEGAGDSSFPNGFKTGAGVFLCTNPFSFMFKEYHTRFLESEGSGGVKVLCPFDPFNDIPNPNMAGFIGSLIFRSTRTSTVILKKISRGWSSGIKRLLKLSGEDVFHVF